MLVAPFLIATIMQLLSEPSESACKHEGEGVYIARVSSDGKFIASAGAKDGIRVWNAASKAEICHVPFSTYTACGDVLFSIDNKSIIYADASEVLRLEIGENSRPKLIFASRFFPRGDGSVPAATTGISLSADGRLLAIGDHTGQITVLGLSDGSKTVLERGDEHPLLSFHCLTKISKNGSTLAYTRPGGKIVLWSLVKEKQIGVVEYHKKNLLSLEFSRDSRYLASGAWGEGLLVWDCEKHEIAAKLEGHELLCRGAFSPTDPRQIATADGSGTIRVWDYLDRKVLQTLQGPSSGVISITYSPSGSLLTTSEEPSVRFWNHRPVKSPQK